MQAFEDVDLDQSIDDYPKFVRGRAAESIDAVRDVLTQPAPGSPEHSPRQTPRGRSTRRNKPRTTLSHQNKHDRGYSWSGQSFQDYSYKIAVDRLRDMLHGVEVKQMTPHSMPGTVHFRQKRQLGTHVPGSEFRMDLPDLEEIVPLLQTQGNYIQQVEGESAYCKEEMASLKAKVLEVVEENKKLHELLKDGAIGDALHGEIISPQGSPRRESQPPLLTSRKVHFGKWQKELERISALHTAKNNRLEAQLSYTKDELKKYENQVDDLKSKLHNQKSLTVLASSGMASSTQGLCIRCAQKEAVLSESQAGLNSVIVRKIEQERDDLMETLTHLKSDIEDMRQRESEACQQVKQSLELVEEAQLEKVQAQVQKEQLTDELYKMRQRFQDLVAENQQKIVQERETVRSECDRERQELNATLKEMSEQFAITETQLERVSREKLSILAELEQAKQQMDFYGNDYSKATDSMKAGIAQASVERNLALQDLNKAKHEVERLRREHEQEKSRLTTELEDVRRRMKLAESDLMDSKEQCIKLTSKSQELDKELHQTKMAKDSIERGRTEDMKSLSRRAEQREEELKAMLESTESKCNKTIAELEDIVTNQNTLVHKLRDECRRQAQQIEELSVSNRKETSQYKTHIQELGFRLEKTQKRVHEMDQEIVKHGRLHEKMRQQLQQMDEHAHHSSQQIIDLLAKQGSLMRDRQLLVKEVEFLRKQLDIRKESESDIFTSSHKDQVDDILSVMNEGEKQYSQE